MPHPSKTILFFGVVAALALSASPLAAQPANGKGKPEPAAAGDTAKIAFFEKQVVPILKARCFKCHGGEAKVRGSLRLTSRAGVLEGGDLGPAVSLKKPDESNLLDAINYGALEMPPDGKMPQGQIDVLTRWVKMGLPWTPGKDFGAKVDEAEGNPEINEKTKNFWSFRPVKRPAVPQVRRTAWVSNPIDAFILHRLESNGLAPASPAEKIALLRRATYDLTGLPPTLAEVDAFLADESPRAFEKVVDRLLESPRYGERWARHWLDLVRFAETNSFERDRDKPESWRYRDYVIKSLNDDKPYDRFVLEQLAGDELDDVTDESIIATGYYRLGSWDDEPTDPLQARYDELDDIVATTGQALLGLTVNCARCHDHKLDPIPQADYYRLLAFFHNMRPYAYIDKKDPTAGSILSPIPGREEQRALSVKEHGANAPETFVLIRGNAHAPGPKVEPAFPQILSPPKPDIVKPKHGKSSGRRLALARWIVSPNNPLTARVMVNRIWQHHFGRGIVRSANNFGHIGERPTHPELLDWLAAEFVARGWRLKAMHKLIMLSNTYQMSSRGNAKALSRDPQNDLFWRFDMRRLGAEEIRDSMLAVNGRLNPKMGGPGFFPVISAAVLQGQSRPGDGWGKSPPRERARRAIYIHVKRSLLTPILESFDFADTDSTCPVRFATTQATQALGLLNGQFTNEQAKALATRLSKEAGAKPAEQVRLALRLAVCRQPSSGQVQRGVALIESLQKEDELSPEAALDQFCLLVLNLNEFFYLD